MSVAGLLPLSWVVLVCYDLVLRMTALVAYIMTGLLVCIVGLDAANKVYSSVPNKMANKLGPKTTEAT